jgi:hypothetical protein
VPGCGADRQFTVMNRPARWFTNQDRVLDSV